MTKSASLLSLLACFMALSTTAHTQEIPSGEATSSEQEHIAPQPPEHSMDFMSYRQMAKLMAMDDTAGFGKILIDQLEWRQARGVDSGVWEAHAWYGNDVNKLWFKTEGEHRGPTTEDARLDLLWDRVVRRWWSVQAGGRSDFGAGSPRNWVAVGLQGLAPQWFDIEATLYAGSAGRTAARVKAEYELLLTQRLILQPEIELNLYGKTDAAKRTGAGLSDADVGLRLRYEVRREFAPYVGIAWTRRFGTSADLARAAGEDTSNLRILAGLRIWF